jgi:hypothetical protein
MKVIAKTRKGAANEYAQFKGYQGKSFNRIAVKQGKRLPFGYHVYDVSGTFAYTEKKGRDK